MKPLLNYYLLLLLVIGCAHRYQPIPETKAPEVSTEKSQDPKDVIIVLDKEPMKESKNFFVAWSGLTTSKESIEKLIPVANCILNHPGFQAEMRAKEFTSTDKTGDEVIDLLLNSGTVSTVSTYRNSRFSPFVTLAYTSDKIYMNTRYAFKAETYCHEHFHTLGFTHANSKDYRSVPYQAGEIAAKYVRFCE